MLIMKAILFTIVALAVPALAPITVNGALAKHWKTSGEFTLAVASAMPADGYTFPVSPKEISFVQLIAHISNADLSACAIASGLDKPELPAKIAEWAKNVRRWMLIRTRRRSF